MYKTRVVLVLRLFLFVTFAQNQRIGGCRNGCSILLLCFCCSVLVVAGMLSGCSTGQKPLCLIIPVRPSPFWTALVMTDFPAASVCVVCCCSPMPRTSAIRFSVQTVSSVCLLIITKATALPTTGCWPTICLGVPIMKWERFPQP